MKCSTIKIKTLTPIWTGDVKQKSTTLMSQGILGGLRTLYQGILQPLLDEAQSWKRCGKRKNENALNICEFNVKKGLDSICPVCRVFGCTGYKARFSLRVSGDCKGEELLNVKAKQPIQNERQNYYYCGGKNGIIAKNNNPIVITLSTPFTASEFDIPLGLICLCAKYMAIGAKTQWGYGAIEID